MKICGSAIVGIGSNNIVNVQVDNDGRLDIGELKKRLSGRVLASDDKALPDEEKKAVFAVVAVIGSTEEGAVDPLDKILKVREEFEDLYGLTFVVHADAAWGGYFTSTLNPSSEELPGQDRAPSAPETPVRGDAVPTLALKPETITQLMSLRDADSITIDPHKSGYIPYPAGGLCYRDGRMRYLLTWTTPYITPGTNVSESIGIYGVEGRLVYPDACVTALIFA